MAAFEVGDGESLTLREAALRGDVEFLRRCVAANKPKEYFLTVFSPNYEEGGFGGNMFHIATRKQEEELIREAIDGKLLPAEVVHQLLCQTQSETEDNPLHVAARFGNVGIVKMFLNAFTSSPPPSSSDLPKPWLMRNQFGTTPCHVALFYEREECGLEILKMDKELLSTMVDYSGNSLLYVAVMNGLNKVAMEILKSSPLSDSSSTNYYCGSLKTNSFFLSSKTNALHAVPNCFPPGGKEICKLLLKPELIAQKDYWGNSVLHSWAEQGKIWPFEFILNSNDIIPELRASFVKLISATNYSGENPLHLLPKHAVKFYKEPVDIGKLLIDTYRKEVEEAHSSTSISTGELQFPWLVPNKRGKRPLDYAIEGENEDFAKLILLEDKNALAACKRNVLFMAIESKFIEVPKKILEIVDEKGWDRLLYNDKRSNVLHVAPKYLRDFFEQLLKVHPELIGGVDKDGKTILHSWVKLGQLWPFEYVLNSQNIDLKWRNYFIDFLFYHDVIEKNSPLHIAATCTHEATHQIITLLVDAFKEQNPNFQWYDESCLPWCRKNGEDEGPVHLAIRHQRDQDIALLILSFHHDMNALLDYYAPKEHKILFLAIENNFDQVVKMILKGLRRDSWTKYLTDSYTGKNVLHLASSSTDREFGGWLVEEAPEFITEQDQSGSTPLDQTVEVGAAWIIEAMLKKDPWSIFTKAPLAWVKACEKGHVSIIHAFIRNCPGSFNEHCNYHRDSPLHHIKLRNLIEYEEFLKILHMKDLINLPDSNGATPLHKAVRNDNIFLAEVLLNMDNIRYNIKDDEGKTARDLLATKCKEHKRWDQMCKRIGFYPNLKTNYFQRKADLLEVRNTLSVVAALLATITFTAGFTLPGGFNQDTGEAILADKATFIVFLISDTLAMCFSMVVLICLIWSMFFEPNESLYLIDRSVALLIASLYLTLLAFITGVYTVISHKSLWAAILIVVICSLVGILAKRAFLYNIFTFVDNLFSFANDECRDPAHLMELGISCYRGESSNQEHPSTSQTNNNDLG